MSIARAIGIVVTIVVLLLLGTQIAQASKCKAYVSISDGTTSEPNSPPIASGLTTCYVNASKTHSQTGANAQTTAQVTYASGPVGLATLKGAVTNTPPNMAGHTATHTPSYARPWDWDARLIGAGLVASAQLIIEDVHLVVPSFAPATTLGAQLIFEIQGAPVVGGSVTLSGDGSCVGGGIYTPDRFMVYPVGPYWHAEYIGPTVFPVEIPLNEYQVLFEVAMEDLPDPPRPEPMAFEPVQRVALQFPDEFTLAATGPGVIPPLVLYDLVDDDPGSGLIMSWEPGPCAGAENYGIYEGTIGDWDSHVAIDCNDDGGDLSETVIPSQEDSYYLVVPLGSGLEGSYGQDTEGDERSPGVTRCETTQDLSCP